MEKVELSIRKNGEYNNVAINELLTGQSFDLTVDDFFEGVSRSKFPTWKTKDKPDNEKIYPDYAWKSFLFKHRGQDVSMFVAESVKSQDTGKPLMTKLAEMGKGVPLTITARPGRNARGKEIKYYHVSVQGEELPPAGMTQPSEATTPEGERINIEVKPVGNQEVPPAEKTIVEQVADAMRPFKGKEGMNFEATLAQCCTENNVNIEEVRKLL